MEGKDAIISLDGEVTRLTAPDAAAVPPGASPRAGAGEAGPRSGLSGLLVEILGLARRHGLTRRDLAQLIRPPSGAGRAEIERAIHEIAVGAVPADRVAVREVVVQLEEALDEAIDKSGLASAGERLARKAAAIVGILAGITCSSLVLGGLIEGTGWLGPPAGLLAFCGVLVLLAVFEALHVAGVQLRRADLGALRDTHPRAFRLQSRLQDQEGIDRFLAGRQIVVIITVFFIARLASFPDLDHLPLTRIDLPAAARPVVALIGIPGALFVLWFGQLLPQFVATRLPLTLLNSLFGSIACRVAIALGGTGLAHPGLWSARLFPERLERIPPSGRFRWEQSVSEASGWGVIGAAKRWTIRPGSSHVEAQTSIRVTQPNLAHIADRTMLLSAAPRSLSFECECTTASEREIGLVSNDISEETLLTGDRRFHKVLIPAIGSFDAGSLIRLTLDADFATEVLADIVHVEQPTRYVLFRVEAAVCPRYFPPARLTVFAVGDGLTDLRQVGEPLSIEPIISAEGLPRIEHAISFPQPNTLYRLDWEVSWR